MNRLDVLYNEYVKDCRQARGYKKYTSRILDGELKPFIIGLLHIYFNEDVKTVNSVVKLLYYTDRKDLQHQLYTYGETDKNFGKKVMLSAGEFDYLVNLVIDSGLVIQSARKIRTTNRHFEFLIRMCIAYGKGCIRRAKIDKSYREQIENIIMNEIRFAKGDNVL